MKRLFFAAALLFALGFSGCKKNNSSSVTPTVTVSPDAADVAAGTQLQFGASVSNTTDTAVTWLINGTAGTAAAQTTAFGGPIYGTIDGTGLYTAPDVLPSSPSVTITAELTDNNSIFNTATVDITSDPVVNVSPATATLAAGQSQTLTVCFYNTTSPAVTWYVGNVQGGNSTLGTVTPVAVTGTPTCTPAIANEPAPQQAVYTAPQIPPTGPVVVTAELVSDPTQTSGATITDTFSPFSMQGTFVFNESGTFSFTKNGCANSGFFSRGGIFAADGQGDLTVTEDINVGGVVQQGVQAVGSYTIGTDGRGTAQVNDSLSQLCGAGPSNFDFVFVNESEVQITEADTFATGHGEGDAQSSGVAFTGDLPANSFAFEFSGATYPGGTPTWTSEIGQFGLSGANFQNAQADIDIGSARSSIPPGSLSGNFMATDVTGRGKVAIQGALYAYYMISSQRVRFLEIDAGGTLTGDAYQQPTTGVVFTTGSLSEQCSFIASGRSPTGLVGAGGVFVASSNGSGTIAAAGSSGNVLDLNNAGVVQSDVAITSASSYGVDANQRGTMSLTTSVGTFTFVFYFFHEGQAVLLETDSQLSAVGMLATQQGRPQAGFTAQSVVGGFTQQWTGAAAASFSEIDTTGQIVLTGPSAAAAAAVAGNWDTNIAFTPVTGNAITGTYTMDVSGRGTMTLTDASGNTYDLSIYISSLSPTSSVIFVLGTDTTRVMCGQLTQQF